MRVKRETGQTCETPEPQTRAEESQDMPGESEVLEGNLEDIRAELMATQDSLKALSEQLPIIAAERDTWKSKALEIHDQYMRARDDIDGFRKRVERDFDDRLTRAMAGLMMSLVEVLDNFDRSLEAAQDSVEAQNDAGFSAFLKGVSMIRAQMLNAMGREGVEPIPSPVGQVMDPALHEAVEAQDGGGEHGVVVEELQKGYKFRNLVLRATKVKVIR